MVAIKIVMQLLLRETALQCDPSVKTFYILATLQRNIATMLFAGIANMGRKGSELVS